jgi:two-component system, chemotaxis family, sensor kinase Cph1
MISANTITKVLGNEGHLLRPKRRELPDPVVANNPGDIEVLLREQCRRAEKTLANTVEELVRCNRALEELAYAASHDLQEPLRMVVAYTQLLAERYRGKLDEDADTYIGYAVDGALRMQGLLEDLLAFSRVGHERHSRTHRDCNAVLDEVLLNPVAVIPGSGAVITFQRLPCVHADGTQLAQLFQNLIGNALKFRGPRTPVITISAEKQGTMTVFAVADNGIGIAAEHLERIFEMFQRLHGRDEYCGNGAGLAICKRIVEQHGGRIWAESKVGAGSIFRFSLPVYSPDQKHEEDHELDA